MIILHIVMVTRMGVRTSSCGIVERHSLHAAIKLKLKCNRRINEIMEKDSVESIINDAAINTVDATPLEIEKAKVKALHRQLFRTVEEKSALQKQLVSTSSDLELQIEETMRLQKSLAKLKARDAMEKQIVKTGTTDDDAIRELKAELASMQKNLADEIKREERIQSLQNQCAMYKEELDSLKQHGEVKVANEKQVLIQNLQKQRSELFVVIKKQMKLIDILKQQRAHVEATALLNIKERDFLKEVSIGKLIK